MDDHYTTYNNTVLPTGGPYTQPHSPCAGNGTALFAPSPYTGPLPDYNALQQAEPSGRVVYDVCATRFVAYPQPYSGCGRNVGGGRNGCFQTYGYRSGYNGCGRNSCF